MMKLRRTHRLIPLLALLLSLNIQLSAAGEIEDTNYFRIETLDKKEKRVMEAVKDGFADIFGSRTVTQIDGYLELDMGLNDIASTGKSYVAVYFERLKGRTWITAYPFTYLNNARVSIDDERINRGIKLLIDGVVKQLNYPYEMSNHRYAGFNEFKNLEEVAGGPLQIRTIESIYTR